MEYISTIVSEKQTATVNPKSSSVDIHKLLRLCTKFNLIKKKFVIKLEEVCVGKNCMQHARMR